MVKIHCRAWTDLEISASFFEKTRFSHFSCNKNGFRCRMTTRVSALQSHDVGEAFQYLRHVCPASTKIFRRLWSQATQWKMAKFHCRTWTDFEISAWFFDKTRFSRFSCNKNGFRRRMTTRVIALQSPDVGEAFQYLRHVCPASRNFLDASEVKLLSENGQNPLSSLGRSRNFCLIFWKNTFFSLFLQ